MNKRNIVLIFLFPSLFLLSFFIGRDRGHHEHMVFFIYGEYPNQTQKMKWVAYASPTPSNGKSRTIKDIWAER